VALNARALRRWLLLLGVSGAAAVGCRSLDLCSGSQCAVSEDGHDGGGRGGSAVSPSAMADKGGAAAAGEAAAGEAAASPVAEGGNAGQAGQLICDGNAAECDGSTLTPCETNVAWQTRHCGACDAVCEGLCQTKRCQPAEFVFEREASAFVVSGSSALAYARYDDTYALILVDRETANQKILLDPLTESLELAASADRFYVFDAWNEKLRSVRLDGSELKNEELAFGFDSFGASADGAYYVDSLYDEEQGLTTYRLWLRAVGATTWKLLREAKDKSYTIVTWSQYGVLMIESGAEETALLEVHGEDIRDISAKLAGVDWDAAAMTAAGPVVTVEPEVGPRELCWLGAEVTRYELPDWVYLTNLNVFEDRLALHGEENGLGFIQLYGPRGVEGDRRGIPLASNFIGMDPNHVWYTVWNTAATRALMRAPWHEITF
jgi:hypothetical protein